MSGFIGHFSVLPDTRIERAKRHELINVLFIGVCAVICGGVPIGMQF